MRGEPEPITWAAFKYRISQASLIPVDNGNGHWTVRGGKWIVHFWPFSEKGTIWAEGTKYKKTKGTTQYVIDVAQGIIQIPPNLIVNGQASTANRCEEVEINVTCPDCGSPMILRFSQKLQQKFYGCSRFPKCKAAHGAHPDGRPLGIPGNAETKAARIKAHAAFDQLWINYSKRKTGRKRAYAVLANLMELTVDECHFGSFTKEQCERAIEICRETTFFQRMMDTIP